MSYPANSTTQATRARFSMASFRFLLFTLSTLLSLHIGSGWADPGGGGGGLGGDGASGPEPSQWSMMIIGAMVLGGVAIYRARSQAKRSV